MFSCSEETFEETDEETYTNVAIQTDPSYPQSMTTNTSSNIKPILIQKYPYQVQININHLTMKQIKQLKKYLLVSYSNPSL